MAERGRPLSPKNQRFAGIPRHFQNGCLYAALLTNGVVKVGLSRNPRTRMGSLSTQVRSAFGCDLQGWFIGCDLRSTQDVYAAEQHLIARMARIGSQVEGRNEFFTGVAFATAVDAVSDVSRAFALDNQQFQEAA